MPGDSQTGRQNPLPRRPLPGLVVAGIIGMAAAVGWPNANVFFAAITFSAISLLVAFLLRALPWSSLGIHAAIIGLGCAWMTMNATMPPADHVSRVITRDRESLQLTARIVSAPVAGVIDARGRQTWRFECEAERLGATTNGSAISGRLQVRLNAPAEWTSPPAYGDRWVLRGVVRRRDNVTAASGGRSGVLDARAEFCRRVATGQGHPVATLSLRLRDRAYDLLGRGMPEEAPSVALSRALVLGYRQDVPHPVYEAFARTGTLHILALSGLHVGIIVLLLIVVLKAGGLTRPCWALVFIPFLTLYVLGTGAAASTIRAALMAVLFYSAYTVRRQPDAPTSLAAAALAILVVAPWQLFNLGFILSFVVVAGLIGLYPWFNRWFRGVAAADPWADPENAWWSGRLRDGWQRIGDLGMISLAAWLASLPIIANAFHLISPIALLVNLLMVPLAFLVLFTACLSLIAGAVTPIFSELFNQANSIMGGALLETVRLSSRLPVSHVYVAPWPWYLVVAWYAALIAWRTGTRGIRWCALIGLTLLVMVSATGRFWSNRINVVAIPHGENLVTIVEGPGSRTVVFDAGPGYLSRQLIDHLRRRGISRIDDLWISRATTDAYGGVTDLLKAMPVGRVIVPEAPPGLRVFHRHRMDWEQHAETTILTWPTNRLWEAPGGLIFRRLYPPPDESYRHARRSSLMLHLSRNHQSALFMSQAGPEIETRALAMPEDWNARRLIVGRIDDVDALGTEWLDRVNPETLVVHFRGLEQQLRGAASLRQRLRSHSALNLMDEPDAYWITRWPP